MKEPPFIVGKPVTGEYFVNREEEMARIITLLSGVVSGKINNIVILGLRRTGKTSLLWNVADNLPKDRNIPVIYDCLNTSTKSMFARRFMDTVLDAYLQVSDDKTYRKKLASIIQKGLDWAKEQISEFEVGLAEYVKFRVKMRELKVNEDELLQSALKYPENLGRSKQCTFTIMLDEFQELLKWGEDFLKMLRTIVQSQKRVTYAFTGSAPTMIRDLVYKERSPFYKQLTEIQVKRLPEEPVRKFVKSRLAKVKINISAAALDRLVYHSGGFPDYVQRLGLNLYLRSLSKKELRIIEESDVEDCYEEMLTGLDGEFTNNFAAFSDLEKDALIALAKGNQTPSSIATEIRKPLSSIPQILIRLLNADVVEKFKEASYRIADPVFSDWLARRYTELSI